MQPEKEPSYLSSLRDLVRREVDCCKHCDFAKKIGIHPVNLSHFLSGKRTLSSSMHETIAEAVGYRIQLIKQEMKVSIL